MQLEHPLTRLTI